MSASRMCFIFFASVVYVAVLGWACGLTLSLYADPSSTKHIHTVRPGGVPHGGDHKPTHTPSPPPPSPPSPTLPPISTEPKLTLSHGFPPLEPECFLKEVDLRRSVSVQGDMQRFHASLQPYIDAAFSGKLLERPYSVLVVGGSFSRGSDLRRDIFTPTKSDTWHGWTYSRILELYIPQALSHIIKNVVVENASKGGVGSNYWMFEIQNIPKLEEYDLIVYESAINDDAVGAKSARYKSNTEVKVCYENVVRYILSLSSRPALLSLEVFRELHKLQFKSGEDAHYDIFSYYQIPTSSGRSVLRPLILDATEKKNTTSPFYNMNLFATNSHMGNAGHRMVAAMVTYRLFHEARALYHETHERLLERSVEHDEEVTLPKSPESEIVYDPLPPVLYAKGNLLTSSMRKVWSQDATSSSQIGRFKPKVNNGWIYRADVKRKFGWIYEEGFNIFTPDGNSSLSNPTQPPPSDTASISFVAPRGNCKKAAIVNVGYLQSYLGMGVVNVFAGTEKLGTIDSLSNEKASIFESQSFMYHGDTKKDMTLRLEVQKSDGKKERYRQDGKGNKFKLLLLSVSCIDV